MLYNELKDHFDLGQLISCSVILSLKKNQKRLYKLSKKNKLDKEELDLLYLVIAICKTIYDNTNLLKPKDPLEDDLYDLIIEKLKEHQDEPQGKKNRASESYDFPELAGTLHKCYHIYDKDRKGDDKRPSLEWYINAKWRGLQTKDLFPMELTDKKDGISIAITLAESQSDDFLFGEKATTRGDKEEGVNVTHIFDGVRFNRPDHWKFKSMGLQVEFMVDTKGKEYFEKLQGKTYKTKRSCTTALLAALIHCTDPIMKREYQKCMRLSVLGYASHYIKGDYDPNIRRLLEQCIPKEMLIRVKRKIVLDASNFYAEVQEFINSRLETREELPYDIDGVVVRLLSKKAIKQLGRKNSINVYQVAYKFPETVKKTIVRGLIVEKGQFNYLGLLAEVDEVLLNGTTHHKGQIHSLKKFNELDLRIGDEVLLKYSGDVMPFLYKDKTCQRGDGERIKLPKICSECESDLIEHDSNLRCMNLECPGTIRGKLLTFCERSGVKDVSEKTIEKLMEIEGMDNPYRMLLINEGDLLTIGINTEKTMNLILSEFAKVRAGIKDNELLSCLAIDKLADKTADTILDRFTLKELSTLEFDYLYDEIIKLPKFKEKKTTGIVDGLKENRELLQKLMSIVQITNLDARKEPKTTYDKMILVSGLRGDADLIRHANEKGYGVSESSWKDVEYLVIKDEGYRFKTKGKKAKDKAIPVILKEEFMEM